MNTSTEDKPWGRELCVLGAAKQCRRCTSPAYSFCASFLCATGDAGHAGQVHVVLATLMGWVHGCCCQDIPFVGHEVQRGMNLAIRQWAFVGCA